MPPEVPWSATTRTRTRAKRPRLLPPLFPQSLLMPDGLGGERRIVAPEDEVAWPEGAAWLEYQPKIAAVLGRRRAA